METTVFPMVIPIKAIPSTAALRYRELSRLQKESPKLHENTGGPQTRQQAPNYQQHHSPAGK